MKAPTHSTDDPDVLVPEHVEKVRAARVSVLAAQVEAWLAEFDESKVVRNEEGEFSEGGDGSGTGKPEPEALPAHHATEKLQNLFVGRLDGDDPTGGKTKAESAARVAEGMLDESGDDPVGWDDAFRRSAEDAGLRGDHPGRGLRGDEDVETVGKYEDYKAMWASVTPEERDALDAEYPRTMSVGDLVEQFEFENGEGGLDPVRGMASFYTDGWANSSGDSDPQAIALQERAASMFGGGDTSYLRSEAGSVLGGQVTRISEGQAPIMDAYLRASYDATQEYLADQGIASITLHRGFGSEVPLDDVTATIAANPLSSWSTSYDVAHGFAIEQVWSGSYGLSVSATIPAEDIFATPFTGAGCLGEKEVIVIDKGDGHDVEVIDSKSVDDIDSGEEE